MRRATRTLTTLGLLTMAAWSVGSTIAPAETAPDTQAATDPKGDVRSPLDLTRVALSRAADGRLRASLTVAAAWTGSDLQSNTTPPTPPGSLCLKAWTTTAPPDTTPDYLICTTANADGALRGSILKQRANKLPERTGGADVSRPSTRTVTLRFSQTAIGKPATLYVAAESTRPGCPRGSCIDLVPDAPKTLKLVLRKATT
ncbi:hypothetical protein [Baekduia sp.]|jgi:hypothetical protein|uniref:hypothetical protein n=1 Tax=Baekduia sp. TaxID=2600305 RepID=UPI002E0BF047|nr:hypothetical protein [Baekduia sp.]